MCCASWSLLKLNNKHINPQKVELIDFSNILNKQQRKAIANALLTPFSWIYGAGVLVREFAFKVNILKEESFDVPVISVGNITVGGTGKTPHVEYIIEALCRDYHIGVLSRGYKRHTKGFIMVRDTLTPKDIGDEPYQIFRKFNGLISMAVCENRCQGIREMLKVNPKINLILLDDAFQHRYVKPKVNIVLIDYNRPPYNDKLLPLGSLREPLYFLLKCDTVVITKCPNDIKPIDIKLIKDKLDMYMNADQQLYFSNVKYANPVPVFPSSNVLLDNLSWLSCEDLILGLTGIANHRPFVKYLRSFEAKVKVIHYDDHHDYTRDDFKYILRVFDELKGRRKFIVTTEKDAVRILNNPYFPLEMRDYIYYVPIRVGFLNYENREFIPELVNKIEAPNDEEVTLGG